MEDITDARSALVTDMRLWLDEPDNADALRVLTERLARLVGSLLAGEELWGSYRWVDDVVLDGPPEVRSDTAVFEGILIWGEGRAQWVEPIAGTISLTADHRAIAAYSVMVCDKARGLKSVPYGAKRPSTWPHAVDWMYEFEWPR